MKKIQKFAAVALAAVFSLAMLAGCQATQETPAFEGLWVIEAIESEDDTVALSAEEIDMLNYALGNVVTLNLGHEGDAALTMFDSVMTGEWLKADDGTAQLTITNLGEAANAEIEAGAAYTDEAGIEGVSMFIEGQTLVVELDGARYVFITEAAELAAQEAARAEAEAEGAAAAEAEAAEEQAGLEAEAANKSEE